MDLPAYNWKFKIVKDSTINLIDQPVFKGGEEGKRVWEGGIMFSRFAAHNSALFRNKKILELGSGGGISGISILKYTNANLLTFTDYKESLLPIIKKNISENTQGGLFHFHSSALYTPASNFESFDDQKNLAAFNISTDPSIQITEKIPICSNCTLCNPTRFEISQIDWTKPVPEKMKNKYDLIIGSDIIYVGSQHEKLCEFLNEICIKGIFLKKLC